MCEENRRADRHRWWLRTDVQDIYTQDGFSTDSFALTNVRMVSISATKDHKRIDRVVQQNIRICLYLYLNLIRV